MHRKRAVSKFLVSTVMNGLRLTQTTGFLKTIVFSGSLILSYLFLGNVWASDADEMIDTGVGKALLKKHCSQCHGIPSAKEHKPGGWRQVVLRMQSHRLKRGYKRLSKSEVTQVSQFLEQAAMIEAAQSENKMDNKNE